MSIKVPANLRERFEKEGCYTTEENLRIYQKWFAKGPRYLFQAVNRKYQITEKVICDVGCGYGMNLLYCQPGSYGIDINEYEIAFAESLNIPIYKRDILYSDLTDLPKVDAVWNSAIMEHVESPHIFLRKLYHLLKPGGLLFVYVPILPLIPAIRHIPVLERYATGVYYGDHINFFVPSTLRWFCERAGFETLEVSPFYPGMLSLLNHVPYLNRLTDGCMYVGRKIENWEYPPNATRSAADNEKGFVYNQLFELAGKKETPE